MSGPGELREACVEAARRGGAVLRQRWGQHRTVEFKGEIDLVTDADRASEAAVLDFLHARFPASSVLAEESGRSGPAAAEAALRWYVDPLDGTTNYAHRVPHFAVTVAAEDRDGLAAGATLDPLRDELFTAARGEGAFLGAEPIQVSSADDLSRALLATGFPYDVHREPEGTLRLFGAYLRRAQGIRRLGAAALDMAYVACGRFDGYWDRRFAPWDVAAGILMVREAGGVVSDFAGGGDMLGSGTLCAAGPRLQPLLLAVLAEARRG